MTWHGTVRCGSTTGHSTARFPSSSAPLIGDLKRGALSVTFTAGDEQASACSHEQEVAAAHAAALFSVIRSAAMDGTPCHEEVQRLRSEYAAKCKSMCSQMTKQNGMQGEIRVMGEVSVVHVAVIRTHLRCRGGPRGVGGTLCQPWQTK